MPETTTLSDGTAGAVEPGSVTFPICQQVINDTLTVSEAEIADAMRKIAVVFCGRDIQLDTSLKAMA